MTDLDEALKRIEDQFGKGSVMTGNKVIAAEVIPTGAAALDRVLGGGMARGAVHEIYGVEGAGKTTLAYSILSEAQKLGKCAFIDAEQAMDRQYAYACGLDVEGLLIQQPDYGEMALETTDQLVKSGGVCCIVVDSVAALTPRVELEGAMGDQTVGLQARMMGQAMRKLVPGCRATNTTVIFINQIREKVGGMGGSPEVQPGGRALKFFASQRIDVRKKYPSPNLVRGDHIYGHIATAKIIKNKIAQSGTKADFDIIYGKGVSKVGSLIDVAVLDGVVNKGGGGYYDFNGLKVQGKDKFAAKLKEESMLDELEKACTTPATT